MPLRDKTGPPEGTGPMTGRQMGIRKGTSPLKGKGGMKPLGIMQKDTMYDSPAMPDTNKIRYPEITLPLSVIAGMDIKVNDTVKVTLEGRISRTENTKYAQGVTVEAYLGDVKKDETKKKESVLDEA